MTVVSTSNQYPNEADTVCKSFPYTSVNFQRNNIGLQKTSVNLLLSKNYTPIVSSTKKSTKTRDYNSIRHKAV